LTDESSEPPSSGLSERRGFWAALIFFGLFAVYHANFSVLQEGDPASNAKLPVALLADHSFAFSTDRFPEMFKWRGRAPFVEIEDVTITNWLEMYDDRTAWDWLEAGRLEFNGPRYFLVEAPRRHAYVSAFGPVPGLMLLPLIAPVYAFNHDLHLDAARYASIVKLGSAGLVAACAALIFLIAWRRTTRGRALLLAATYGLATCAWAVSSQNIWQQTANQFLLTAGAYFFLGDTERRGAMAWAGLFLGAATACRVTSALVLIAVAVHLAIHHRRSVLPFVAAALPSLMLIGVHNAYYFGNPLTFAQALAGPPIALEKTGSPSLWQTPVYVGALGLLASPSRGLLIFSPVLAPAGWGLVRSIADPAWRGLRALGLAALATMALQCAWFDWWGGHAYGYRPWLDVMPFLVLLLLPVLDELTRTRLRRALYGVAFAWSAGVQALGAWSYDRTWNTRALHVVRVPDDPNPVLLLEEHEARDLAEASGGSYVGPASCDVDRAICRYRLWSLSDNMIGYYLGHFSEARKRRWRARWTVAEEGQ
jgi:hypothetical protein